MIAAQMESLTVGIDIGGTNIRFALVDGSGHILHRSRTSSRINEGLDVFCGVLLNGITEARRISTGHGSPLVGVGVGVPGLVDRWGMVRSSVNMRPLDGFHLSAYIEEQTGLPTVCGNDANLIALGEHAYGVARGLDSFIVITIGTGLGSGLVLNRRLWSGIGGFAAEFGHVTVEPEGALCPCGNRGCLERYVSADAIVRFVQERFADETTNMIPALQSAEQVGKLARQGNIPAQAGFEYSGRYLGIALASLTNTLNLQAAVICGGVSASLDLMLPAIHNELTERCFPQIAADFSVISGILGDDAGVLGAAALLRTKCPPLSLMY